MRNPLITLVLILAILFSFAGAASENSAKADTEFANKLLFVSTAHSNKAKVRLLQKMAKQHKNLWQIEQQSARSLSESIKDSHTFAQLFNRYDLVILDAVSAHEAQKNYGSYSAMLTKVTSPVIAINALSHDALNKRLNSEISEQIQSYWQNAGRTNLNNMLSFISSAISNRNTDKVPAPIIFPKQGIYHPELSQVIVNDLASYQQIKAPKPQQPKIALLLQRALIETEQTQLIDSTIAQLEAKGAYVVPFYFELSPASGDYSQLLQTPTFENGKVTGQQTAVDLIINFRNIHWANKRKVEFEQFGVPVIQAMTYYSGDQVAWEQDMQGVSPGMTAFTLVLPETAGVVDPMVVAAMDMKSQQVEIIDYQLQHLVNKALNVVKLKYKANQDKKLTVFVWGDKDVGASFMNIPDSIEAISERLAQQGYQTSERDAKYITDNIKQILDPFYRDYQLTELLAQDLAELMPIDTYLAWFNSLPRQLTEKINDHWGQPQDNFMAVEKNGKHYFILPRIRNGNMLIMRQPPRSDNKNDENMIYHQGIVPINHFYLAAYFYAREYWQSDAIIHLGTHGSQEYLNGKERGLSIYDQGNLAVWDTPVIYPFIVDDVGEAMQTKRRGRATVISHMTPPFAAAGLQGEIRNLHELMHQYKQLDQGGVKQKTAKQLTALCFDTNVCRDIDWQQPQIDRNFDQFIEALHLHLEDLATANQPLGLHTFGQLAEQDLLISSLIQMLGQDFSQRASDFEHKYFEHQHFGYQQHQETTTGEHSHNYHQTAKDTEQDVKQLAGYQTVKQFIVNSNAQATDIAITELSDELQADIKRGKTLYQSMLGINELNAMSDALSGKYIPVKTGGDPIRHPESLATGFNLYGFDPSRVPTQAAYQQGKELTEQMIANYYQQHQQYPDKMAFSLWSIETMRHYGVLEAQVMAAIGVKPKWSADGRVIGTEVIPYSELKRPRVDVVLSATGLYRDAFPNVMQLLAKAINQVAELTEDNNSIWLNSKKIKAELIADGLSKEDAQYLSTIRIFSNKSGDYGSGVDDATWASDTWETDKKIADNYLSKMGYFYGADNKRWGQKVTNNQGQDIQLYAKQLSGTDIAMFARSSNLFGMLSSDDPFEYFGALNLAVRNIDGKSPDMVVSNLRDANNAKAEDASLFLAKELRTRMFHPRWIKEMQKEGYSGAVSLASRMDNFFGWQVVSPDLVRNDQWDQYMDVYVNDKLNLELDKWFKEINPAALARMMERMLEAERKDYWQADPQRLKQLVEKYIDIVQQNELVVLNDALKQHVNELATGFGLAPLNTAQTIRDMAKTAMAQKLRNAEQLTQPQATPEQNKQTQQQKVEGQKLEKQTAKTNEANNNIYYSLAAMLFIVIFGACWQTMLGTTSRHQRYLLVNDTKQ